MSGGVGGEDERSSPYPDCAEHVRQLGGDGREVIAKRKGVEGPQEPVAYLRDLLIPAARFPPPIASRDVYPDNSLLTSCAPREFPVLAGGPG